MNDKTLKEYLASAENVVIVTSRDNSFSLFSSLKSTESSINFLLAALETLIINEFADHQPDIQKYAEQKTKELLEKIDKKFH